MKLRNTEFLLNLQIQDFTSWIKGPQRTDPEYLKNAESEHLIGFKSDQ
jgi:hypothetical protein